MRRWRRGLIGLAVFSWSAGIVFAVLGAMGIIGTCWWFGHSLMLTMAAVSTVSLVVTDHVISPRVSYRLGWNARDRLDAHCLGDVTKLDNQRHA